MYLHKYVPEDNEVPHSTHLKHWEWKNFSLTRRTSPKIPKMFFIEETETKIPLNQMFLKEPKTHFCGIQK